MKEKIDWNTLKRILIKGQQAKEIFQEPSDWQMRLMRRIRMASPAPISLEAELNSLSPFIFKFSFASVLCAIIMQTIILSSSTSTYSTHLVRLLPTFSAAELLWENK